MAKILDGFLRRAKLLDSDKKLLQEKRGFNDKTISNAHLVSACPENEKIILELVKEFGRQDALAQDLIKIKNDEVIVNAKFTESNIIIPYMDGGECVMLRPHKYNPKGVTSRIYYCRDKFDPDAITIMCEGEFKALAAEQYGYQAFAVPGISSFVGDKEAGKRFVEFYEDLQIRGVRDVLIIFDNEDKCTEGMPRYKPDKDKRYDTQYYAYLMSAKINEYQADLASRVSWIPDKYRDETGKADIDGMLASGVPEEEFDAIVDASQEPIDFLNELSDEAHEVINEKLSKREERVEILERRGIYIFFSEDKDGNRSEHEVSNFVFRYVATYKDENDLNIYEFSATNIEKFTATARITGEEFASTKFFRSKLMGCGKFVWNGTTSALDALFRSLIPASPKIVLLRKTIGWDEEMECFFFDNCLVTKDGDIILYDKDNIVKYKDKFFKIESSVNRPKLVFAPDDLNYSLDKIKILGERLHKNFAIPQTYLALSWFIGCAYKPWLFALNRTFPILFVFGKKGSGKTRLVQWLMRIFYQERVDIIFQSSTKPGIRNQSSELPYLPIWIDEFRNDEKGKQCLDMLRGMYDHSQTVMSSGRSGQNMAFQLKSALVMSGEHIPDDETGALNQRMITVHIPDRIPGTEFDWLEIEQETFSGIFTFLLKNREKFVPRIISEYEQILATYRNRKDIHQRIAINYSIIHAIAKIIFGVDSSMLNSETVFSDINKEEEESNPIVEMLRVCTSSYGDRHSIDLSGSMITKKNKDGSASKFSLHFNLPRCVDLYNKWRRDNGKPAVASVHMRRVMKDCKWVEQDDKPVRINGNLVKCYEIQLSNIPETILSGAYNIASDAVKSEMITTFGGENGLLSTEDDQSEYPNAFES